MRFVSEKIGTAQAFQEQDADVELVIAGLAVVLRDHRSWLGGADPLDHLHHCGVHLQREGGHLLGSGQLGRGQAGGQPTDPSRGDQVAAGDEIAVRVADGTFGARVE